MKNFVLSLLVIPFLLSACKTQSGAMGADNVNKSKPVEINENNPEDVFDILVSFISKGEGIDYETRKKVDSAILEFNKKNNTSIEPEKIYWGREGEVDYGFMLKNLSTKQKSQLSSKLKAAIGVSEIVFIDFNKKCVHKR